MRKRRAGGRVQLRAIRLMRLPAIMNITECAEGLGVSRQTVMRWIESGMPIFGTDYRRTIRKLRLIEWLVATKKFRRRRR
jgi:DNA-binding XRE family transcriptional regulator